MYQNVPGTDETPEYSNKDSPEKMSLEDYHVFAIWGQQFVDAVKVLYSLLYMFNNQDMCSLW